MKKLAIFAAGASLLLMSAVAFAETPAVEPNKDGLVITNGPALFVEKDGYGNRQYDPNALDKVGDQTAKLTVTMNAFLPCYLDMKVVGNDINTRLQSWGDTSDATATINAATNFIYFAPNAGGYLKGWDSQASSFSNKYEIEPGSDVFIRACDTFRTELYSNLNYKYSVKVLGGSLVRKAGEGINGALNLPVIMRSAMATADAKTGGTQPALDVAGASWSADHNFSVNPEAQLVSGANFCNFTTVLQQFKVPYDKKYAAGKYTGTVEFFAATL